MFRPFAAAVLLSAPALAILFPVVAQAATARTYGSLSVAVGHDRTNEWYAAHRTQVFSAANCRILQNLGNGQYLAQTNTPGGVCRYIIQERREQRKDKNGQPMTIYRITYVRNESGRLVDFELIIAMTGRGESRTDIGMWIMADVAGRFVPQRAVSGVLEGSRSGVTRYIQNNAR